MLRNIQAVLFAQSRSLVCFIKTLCVITAALYHVATKLQTLNVALCLQTEINITLDWSVVDCFQDIVHVHVIFPHSPHH